MIVVVCVYYALNHDEIYKYIHISPYSMFDFFLNVMKFSLFNSFNLVYKLNEKYEMHD